jgi:methionyl-tRNA formyltransferase
MTEQVDEGPILLLQKMPVIPGETYGIHVVRLGALAAEIVMQVVTLVENNTTPEQQTDEGPALFFSRPDKGQVTIDWQQQTAAEIDALVNAGNPKYNGAFTRIRHMELTVLEVGFADFDNAPAETQPGTIVYADGLYGPIVACADGKFVKINAVCIPEGYISGSKLFSLGFGVGEKFI